ASRVGRLVSSRAKWFVWAVLLFVLGVALAIGASRPSPVPTPTQRAATIDNDLRCPSCEDISVADSSAPAAIAIRKLVAQRVHEGESTSQIEAFLVSRYGPGILLRPPVAGGTAAVWLVPLVAVSVAVAVLGVFFWRRRRPAPVDVSDDDRSVVEEALHRVRAGPAKVNV
ncbi:MAG: cytochrome c-type biogenesis protein, partial [Acidimicrobiales bacterium]